MNIAVKQISLISWSDVDLPPVPASHVAGPLPIRAFTGGYRETLI